MSDDRKTPESIADSDLAQARGGLQTMANVSKLTATAKSPGETDADSKDTPASIVAPTKQV